MSVVPKVGAAIAGLAALAYLMGWMYAQAFFGALGARWLVTELPFTTVLGYSWLPVVGVLLLASIGVCELLDEPNRSNCLAVIKPVLRYGPLVLLLVSLLQLLLLSLDLTMLTGVGWGISAGAGIFITAAALVDFVARDVSPTTPDRKRRLYPATMFIIIFWFWHTPHTLGLHDSKTKNLPQLAIRDSQTDYRLLLSNGNRYYAFASDDKRNTREVFVFSASEVASVWAISKDDKAPTTGKGMGATPDT